MFPVEDCVQGSDNQTRFEAKTFVSHERVDKSDNLEFKETTYLQSSYIQMFIKLSDLKMI